MRRLSAEEKFRFFAFGIPLALALFWAGGDFINLAKNYLKIATLKKAIAQIDSEKALLDKELTLLKKGDPLTLEHLLRQEYRALRPNEIEYRIK